MYRCWNLLLLGLFCCVCSISKSEIIFSDSIGTSNCYEEGYSLLPFQNGYLCNAAQLCTNGSGKWENKWFQVNESGDSIGLITNDYSGFGKKLSNGDFIIYGGEKAGLVFDSVFIHRFNAQGQWLWTTKSFLANCRNTPNEVLEDKAGNIYICGIYGTGNCNNPTYQSFILKLDLNGNKYWTKSYSYGGTSSLQFYDIKLQDNALYLAGFVDSLTQFRKVYYSKLDSSGDLIWWKTIANTNDNVDGYGISRLEDQLYVLAYDDSVRLFLCDTLGNFQSVKNLGASCGSRYFKIKKSLDKYLLILANKSINGDCSSTFSKVNDSGNLLWEKNFGGLLRTFSEIDSGSFLLSGYDGFLPKAKIIRFDTTYTSRPPITNSIFSLNKNEVSLYPNPSRGHFRLEFNNRVASEKIELYNVSGVLLHKWVIEANGVFQVPATLENGIYFIKPQALNSPLKKLVLIR